MEITVDFDVLSLDFKCSCGNPLSASESKGAIELDPCQVCTDAAYSQGRDDGHDEGYAEGKKDGLEEASKESE